VDRLERYPGVRVHANPLTGRVLVEITNAEVALDDLLADVADLEAPALPGEDRPAHPLDPAPLLQSATRTVGAALGLGLLAARQLAGMEASSVAPAGPATVAGIIGILQGFPLTRHGLRVLLGRHVADLLFSGAAIVSLTLAGSPLGLAITGAEALRLLTEVVARRAAWRRYEERLEGVASAEPGAVIRLEAGERTPLAASVIEGTGSALDRDGLPVPVAPGTRVPAGARLWGGPCVVELAGVLPLGEGAEAAEALALAAGIAIAAGSPWGGAFPVADHAPATDGAFDGSTASAHVGDVPYTLGLPRDGDMVPAAIRLRH